MKSTNLRQLFELVVEVGRFGPLQSIVSFVIEGSTLQVTFMNASKFVGPNLVAIGMAKFLERERPGCLKRAIVPLVEQSSPFKKVRLTVPSRISPNFMVHTWLTSERVSSILLKQRRHCTE